MLANIDLEHGVGMIVTPAPIGLLVVLVQSGKIAILAMVLFCVHTVRLIFMIVPLMIVVVIFVVVAAGALVILGSQRRWRDGYWDDKRGTPAKPHSRNEA